jgi:hypothetical protein
MKTISQKSNMNQVLLNLMNLFWTKKAHTIYAVVAIARNYGQKCSSDMAYHYSTGFGDLIKLINKTLDKAILLAPNCDIYNRFYHSSDETFWMIILSCETNISGCKRKTFSPGFGITKELALDEAIKRLSERNWQWDEKTHEYKIEEELECKC